MFYRITYPVIRKHICNCPSYLKGSRTVPKILSLVPTLLSSFADVQHGDKDHLIMIIEHFKQLKLLYEIR